MVRIIVVLALGALSMSLLSPILPLYLTDIGITPAVLGLMFSAGMIGSVFGESSWGWIADRIGIKVPFSVGTFVCGLMVLCFALTLNVPAFFVIFFFWGVARSALIGPGRGYIGTNAPPLKKATFMAIMAAVLSASRGLGALPSGFIVDNWGYDWVFFIACGIALLSGVIVLAGLRNVRLAKAELPATYPLPTDELLPQEKRLNYRPLTFQCLVASLIFFGLGIMITFLPLLATQVVGLSASEVGILFTVRALVAMVVGIPMGMLADRKGKKIFMILGLLVSAVGMAGIAFAGNFLWLMLFSIITGLGLSMFSPAALGLLSDAVPLQRQSTIMGFYGGMCENIGVVGGSALGGFIWSTWGPQVTFLSGTLAAVLGAIICFGLVKDRATKADCLSITRQ